MKILIVDDHGYNRELLSFILADEGYDFEEAANGVEACDVCRRDATIDLVLMDVTMPEMDGITATSAIKKGRSGRLLPIIFVTALDDADVLARCLDAGGDDFVPKPINESVLLAKIKAHGRTGEIYKNLQEANKQLEYHKQLMDREHSIFERLFDCGADRIKTDCDNVKKYTSSISMFNGDIVLDAPAPSGGIYNLVGDFTGHGLAASIGTLPVTEIFYRLASQQANVGLMAKEINKFLIDLFPDNMFFCAVITYIDALGKGLSLWAGGMNDVLWFADKNDSGMQRIPSEHMPLGILSDEEFDETLKLITLSSGDQLYVYTDGVNEATNDKGEVFGLDRIESILRDSDESPLDTLIDSVHGFQKHGSQNDDISILEITAGPLKHVDKRTREVVDIAEQNYGCEAFLWHFSAKLEGEELRNSNIVDQLMAVVGGIKGIELHREKVFTIVSELYSNALEHGVLNLDSALKETPDGFERYYALREQRLRQLENHFIDVNIAFRKGDCNHIVFELTDSGRGFDFSVQVASLGTNVDAFGRGLPLLHNLCSVLEYSNEGRTVKAIYDLRYSD